MDQSTERKPGQAPVFDDDLRDRILAEPEAILEDRDVMRALIEANERALGSNIVDLRGIAMERLEARLNRLEDTHRSVIAAAYENLAGTNQVHRAILRMLDPEDFTGFVQSLGTEVAEILKVEQIVLVLEAVEPRLDASLKPLENVLKVAEPGFIDSYIRDQRAVPVRKVTLRQIANSGAEVYGARAGFIRSEALLKLDFGEDKLPGMLVMGSEDPHQFRPNQGTDLLGFFAAVFERSMRHWLA